MSEHWDTWETWMGEIPYLSFPSNWRVQVLPSFGGASARFCVINSKGAKASVFLDLHGNLTINAPCWEVNDEHLRFAVHDTDALINAIEALEREKRA